MKYSIIIFVILLISAPGFSETPAEILIKKLEQIPSDKYIERENAIIDAISTFEPLKQKCGKPKDYEDLFELVPHIRGASLTEYIGEITGMALVKCPETYLRILNTLEPSKIKTVVESPVTPPWEIAEAVLPYLEKPELKKIIDKYYRKLVLKCTNKDGKGKVGCF